MQISTQISTQVILNQDDLTEAIIEYIKARTDLPADSKFAVDFEDDVVNPHDLTAVVNITAATNTAAAPATTSKPATTPRKAKPAAATAAPAPVTTVVEQPVEQPNISAAPEDRQDPNQPEDPPFDVEEPAKAAEIPVQAVVKSLDSATSSTPKIFPDTTTSAPTPKIEEVDPAVKAKSLFANLSKPTN